MELTEEQLSDIRLLLRRYWNGDKELKRYSINETVQVTVDHTEDDEVVFAVSIGDSPDFTNYKTDDFPDTLSELSEFSTMQEQINTIVAQCITPNCTPFTLYREPTIPTPMAQYIGTVDLKSA